MNSVAAPSCSTAGGATPASAATAGVPRPRRSRRRMDLFREGASAKAASRGERESSRELGEEAQAVPGHAAAAMWLSRQDGRARTRAPLARR
uniref:Uncharacterized protein n=1 Tax=Arundo donax TaxID=35708 RepID=A0A0A9ER36_ARUDO